MPKLSLMFDNKIVKEVPVGNRPVTIGRSPDNDIPVDNLAVSNHHAKVYFEAGRMVVEDLDSHAAGLEINFRVMVGHGEVVHRYVVVRRAADGYRPVSHGYLFHDFVVKHEAELRHLNFLQQFRSILDFCATHGVTTKTIPWIPFQSAQSRR